MYIYEGLLKIISFILTLVMMLSLSVNVFAAEPLTDDPNMIEWKYTVFADETCRKLLKKVLFQMHMPDILGAESH